MKTIVNNRTVTNIAGYLAAFLVVLASVFKINHLEGANEVMIIAGFFLSIYFPVYILSRIAGKNEGELKSAGYYLAVSVSFINLAVVFKIQHWNGASFLLLAGFALLCFVYLPMLLTNKMKGVVLPHFRWIYASGFAGALLLTLGLIFKIMHWPISVYMMITGALFLFLVYFPLYIYTFSKSGNGGFAYLREIFFGLIVGGILTTLLVNNVFSGQNGASGDKGQLSTTSIGAMH